jgi:hypothetical protein
VAVAALLVGLALWGSATAPVAEAQEPPATYYGAFASPGDQIVGYIDGVICDQTTANVDGEWVVVVVHLGCGGGADEGAVVTFSVNGVTANETELWTAGGAPDDLVNGIDLTLVLTPRDLAEFVEALRLAPSAEHPLAARARAAARALAGGRTEHALRHLDRFLGNVEALQDRGRISTTLAGHLTTTAQTVRAAVGP